MEDQQPLLTQDLGDKKPYFYGDGVLGSKTVGKLSHALAACQGEMQAALKTSINPHLRNKYANLDSCWDACREPLAKNGLAVMQWPSVHGKSVTITTVLSHLSGEWMSSSLTMEAADPSPQKVGTVLTYGRRYGLSAAIGLTSDDDDDGEQRAAPQRGKMADQDAPLPESFTYIASEQQRGMLKDLLQAENMAEAQMKVINRRAYNMKVQMTDLREFCKAEAHRMRALDELAEAVNNYHADPSPVLKDNRETIETKWTTAMIENATDRLKGSGPK